MKNVILTEEQFKKAFPFLNEDVNDDVSAWGGVLAKSQSTFNPLEKLNPTVSNDNSNTYTASSTNTASTTTQNTTPAVVLQVVEPKNAQEAMNFVMNVIYQNGESNNLCARGVYAIARGYAKGIASQGALRRPSGKGDAESAMFINTLINELGYTLISSNENLDNGVFASTIEDFAKKCQIGDIFIYYTQNPVNGTGKILRHTQICTSNGNISSRFSCDKKNNYGSYFVYKSKLVKQQFKWTLKVLRAPGFARQIQVVK